MKYNCFGGIMGKKYEILDANERIEFYRVYEIINAVIGTDYSGWMKACWPNVMGNGKFRIWFPKLAETKNGNLVSAAFDCVNTISDDWGKVIFDDLKGRQTDEGERYTGYDLVFAKEPKGGPYLFRGVYVRDPEESFLNHSVSKRIALKVKLIGVPTSDIELISEDILPNTSKNADNVQMIKREEVNTEGKCFRGIAESDKMIKTNTLEVRLRNRILREFPKKKLLGDIRISDDEFNLLIEYFKRKYNYMRTSGTHVIVDPVFCVALIQIGIRYYDGAYWSHVKRILNDPRFNVNHQGWIGTSFAETLKQYDKLQVTYTDRVDTLLMHSFVSDVFAEKFFNFLYAFYKIDLDRDINRLDTDAMNELTEIIKKNDNSGRTYFLVEHTADAVRQNERGAKTRIRRYLKLIDKAFWGDSLPTNSSVRLMQHFLNWKDTAAEFIQERSAHGGYGKRGKKSFASPYIKYDGKNNQFVLILPPQIIRFQELENVEWEIDSDHYHDVKEINPYSQGVTGYKTDLEEIHLLADELFDSFTINLLNGNVKLRTFRIAKEAIRFFDADGDFIRNDSLSQGKAYSFTKAGFKPESEAITESFYDGTLLRTAYDFVNGDIIRIPDGRPLSVGGSLNEGILLRGIIGGVYEGKFDSRKSIYVETPSVFVKMQSQKSVGTAIRVNERTYHFSKDGTLADGISEFDLMDRTGECGYIIDLRKFGCLNDGKYSISIDVPNDKTSRQWQFVLIKDFEYGFDDAPYIFKTRGTLNIPESFKFKATGDIQEEHFKNSTLFNFDIIPGESYIYLEYQGLNIGFEIPMLSYKFRGDDWHIGPHIDIWHDDFDPRLFVTYNADKIRIFLDEDDDSDEEHSEIFSKNKSKGIFDCDLNRFKSWFGRDKIFRHIYIELPGVQEAIPFVKIVTQSIFNSGLLRADFENKKLIGEFEIIGNSNYYVDIEYDGKLIAEKAELKNKRLELPSELRTGIYKVKVYESEEDESGFGDVIFYEIGSIKTELLNPEDLSGMNIEIAMIHSKEDQISYLPLATTYQIVDLNHSPGYVYKYTGKMIVGSKKILMATFPVAVEFFDPEKLQRVYVTFLEDVNDEDGLEFLYDDYRRVIVKQEDTTIPKSQAYRRYKQSLYPEDYIFEIKFIERPKNADEIVNDERYNNLTSVDTVQKFMKQSIFKN